jgi:hypothetical protein
MFIISEYRQLSSNFQQRVFGLFYRLLPAERWLRSDLIIMCHR